MAKGTSVKYYQTFVLVDMLVATFFVGLLVLKFTWKYLVKKESEQVVGNHKQNLVQEIDYFKEFGGTLMSEVVRIIPQEFAVANDFFTDPPDSLLSLRC